MDASARAAATEDPAKIPPATLAVLERLELVARVADPSPRAPGESSGPPATGTTGGLGGTPPPCGPSLAPLSGRAPRLAELVLSGCAQLAARGLAEAVPQLSSLVLRDLDLTDEDLAAIGHLGSLRALELDKVRAPSDLQVRRTAGAPLERLVLRDLPHRSPLVELVRVHAKTLRTLVLEGRWADSRTLLAAKPARGLVRLEVLGTRAGDYGLHALAGHEALREVVLAGRGFTDAAPLYLRDLAVETFACECPRLGDAGIGHLRFLEHLTRLRLVEPAASPAGLANLGRARGLEVIELDGVALAPPALEAIGGLERLRALYVSSGALEAEDLAPLGRKAHLEALLLRVAGLDDRRLGTLPVLPALRSLDLAGTAVGDDALHRISAQAALVELDLSATRVTRRLGPLAKLRRLVRLDLARTDTVDDGVAHLSDLAHLADLDLSQTLVSTKVLDHLEAMPGLARVDLRGTRVDPAAARARLGGRGVTVLLDGGDR